MTLYKSLIGVASLASILVISLCAGHFSLKQRVVMELHDMFKTIPGGESKILSVADLAHLPEPVQRWLLNSNVVGREKIQSVRLKQKGFFRLGQEKEWIPFTAEEYFVTENPAFLWSTKMRMAPMINVAGRDRYFHGHGHMLIKLLSLIPVANARGEEIDQATMQRYLNEIMWFPSAAVSEYITWEQVDANAAKATMSYGGATASAIFYFNESGALINMTAQRYRYVNGDYQLDEWHTPLSEYGEFDGVRVPIKGEGVWKLDSGDFSYIRLEIIEIEYNNPTIYK